MNQVQSILLAEVGRQGVLRASDILSEALMAAGYDIKKSGVHGMAQRGGCVTSFVRFGKKVYSPTGAKGEATTLLAFKKMETIRYLDYLMPQGRVIVNEEEINPQDCNLGTMKYPNNVKALISNVSSNTQYLHENQLA